MNQISYFATHDLMSFKQTLTWALSGIIVAMLPGCQSNINREGKMLLLSSHTQITHSAKHHALDNNDNFSPDGSYLCYDTRGTVYNNNLANCKSIEKVAVATGVETVLWEPPSVTGEQAAPGVAAVSWHPIDQKVVFIHGPFLEEVDERGHYTIRNRTGVTVDAGGKGQLTRLDMRDINTSGKTIFGAHRGGTHRHEYTRNGQRIGFTYDDYLLQNYDRTIGFMVASKDAPEGYSHLFAILVKPAPKGESAPGELEKAWDDSWVDKEGKKRAFIGKVRAENGVDYEQALFTAEIPDNVDITTAVSGDAITYPEPPEGIVIRRITHSDWAGGIVRGSNDGKRIAYFGMDTAGIRQVFVVPENGSDWAPDPELQPRQVTDFDTDASCVRWHPGNNWVFAVADGDIVATYVGEENAFGTSIWLTNDALERTALVVSPDGNMLAYNIKTPHPTEDTAYTQIYVLPVNMDQLNKICHDE
ncbi:DUF3748 domain-containing protein [Fulvivirgaceae bacterium BMA12]|uniref:DUF3748 domain-containing protein n=1 Tax=Agaribacillus aureus TaxID=3051825 RepID=A0ABT8LK11_9BACT|nr:DUF3748 domain-containing protein [Fulvivirgaceae bacterium BMA12]